MGWAFGLALLAYSAWVTILVLKYRGKAARYDDAYAALLESETARVNENKVYFEHNQSWQKSNDDLKKLVHGLQFDLGECRTSLREATKRHPAAEDPGPTET